MIFFVAAFAIPFSSEGQQDSARLSYSIDNAQIKRLKLFESDDILEITLKFDISYLRRKKPDTEDLNAVISYFSEGADTISENIKVRARGNFRKNYCDFPPISLNFKKNDSIDGEFSGADKLKLVTYCKRGMQNEIFKEYLVYRLYNILTDQSFRVRLLKITFINSAKIDDKPLTEYGFVIEPVSSLEQRIKSEEIKNVYLTQKNVVPEIMNRMAIFNYMVGNTDWSVPIRHNAMLMTLPGSEIVTQAIVVPFDFDFSGIVNTDYSAPFEGLGIESTQERRYLGVCMSEDDYAKALAEFREHEQDFYNTINEFPWLPPREKKEMILFLKGFYSLLDKRNTIISLLMKDCLTF
ncbi:MAG: hypothetical protein MUE32_05390 [Bacteroidales bacterium]|nr:hypothetical protein [Bacteroidales bacterium]